MRLRRAAQACRTGILFGGRLFHRVVKRRLASEATRAPMPMPQGSSLSAAAELVAALTAFLAGRS